MKSRTITEVVEVPVQLADGRTRMGRQTVQRQAPAVPRDWDHIILNAVTVGAVVFLAVSVVWTAASVGALLSQAAPAWVAYAVAAGFDLVWVMCLGLEWVARHDRERAAVPRKAGFLFLLISMSAVGVHGWHTAAAVGIFGAVVAALAKGLWAVVLRYRHVDLPEPVRDVLTQERAELGLEIVLAQHQRTALRTRAQLAAYRAALGVPEDDRAEGGQEQHHGADGRAAGTIRAAVLAAQSTLPGADPAAIVAQLAHAGIAVDEDTVRDVIGPRQVDDADDAPHAAQQVGAVAGLSKAAAIVEAASLLGSDAPATQVADLVRRMRGLDVPDNYVRTVLSRARGKDRKDGVGQGGGGYA
ncbi:hypothetical protein [Streptomyces gibsoniae]|uniref:Protein transporter Sec31 n=1 Tax=Streptomyces gibsoniae TaxID=3075529 RepID=A0ABU2U9H2_9ACTN|nr:hypothetical protein [Streptomyces sp. DSM 41699]MDT0469681.1 hypothetical protein [Streptomyces sp. DSM 41699]